MLPVGSKGTADLRSISPTAHACSDYVQTHQDGGTEKSLGLERGQCQTGRGNGGCTGEESQGRSRAKQRNKAKLEQDGTTHVQQKPRSSEKPFYYSQDQLKPSKGGFASRSPENALPCMSKDCCPFPLSGSGAAGEACSHSYFAKHPDMSSASIRIPSPVHTELLCWHVSWSHTEGHVAFLSVQELVFQALDRFGKPLRLPIMFCNSLSCLLPYLQLHWQSSNRVSSLIHLQQSTTSLAREVRPQAGTFFQIQLKRFWPSDIHLPSTPQARLALHSPTVGVV